MKYFDIMNGSLLYLMVSIGLLFIAGFCVITAARAWKRALELGMSTDTLKMIARSSLLYTIVPSLSIVIGFFSLAPVLGVAWSWFRLSVLGAVNYELMTADMFATSSGFESIAAMAQTNDPSLIGGIMLTMSLCILTSPITSMLFSKKILNNMNKTSEKNPAKGAVMIACFSLAIAVVFAPVQFMQGPVKALTALTSMAITLLHMVLVKKYKIKWLKDFTLANALILGMASSIFWTHLFA